MRSTLLPSPNPHCEAESRLSRWASAARSSEILITDRRRFLLACTYNLHTRRRVLRPPHAGEPKATGSSRASVRRSQTIANGRLGVRWKRARTERPRRKLHSKTRLTSKVSMESVTALKAVGKRTTVVARADSPSKKPTRSCVEVVPSSSCNSATADSASIHSVQIRAHSRAPVSGSVRHTSMGAPEITAAAIPTIVSIEPITRSTNAASGSVTHSAIRRIIMPIATRTPAARIP